MQYVSHTAVVIRCQRYNTTIVCHSMLVSRARNEKHCNEELQCCTRIYLEKYGIRGVHEKKLPNTSDLSSINLGSILIIASDVIHRPLVCPRTYECIMCTRYIIYGNIFLYIYVVVASVLTWSRPTKTGIHRREVTRRGQTTSQKKRRRPTTNTKHQSNLHYEYVISNSSYNAYHMIMTTL